jgi:hypothetical protein
LPPLTALKPCLDGRGYQDLVETTRGGRHATAGG